MGKEFKGKELKKGERERKGGGERKEGKEEKRKRKGREKKGEGKKVRLWEPDHNVTNLPNLPLQQLRLLRTYHF